MAKGADLAERSFERLAAQEHDLTAKVLVAYYRRFPDAADSFEHHGLGDRQELEGRMVTTTAFMLLQWALDPTATKIEQGTTITHHHDALLIGPQWYLGLVDAVLEVLYDSIPADAPEEVALWQTVRADIAAFIDSVRPEFWRTDKDGPLPDDPSTSKKLPN